MDKDILKHPILVHQQDEAELVLKYAQELVSILQEERKDLIQPIIVDVLIKLFRSEICGPKQCGSCKVCTPTPFMSPAKFWDFITTKRQEIIEIVAGGFNNSFNIPQRGIFIQKVIDRIFKKDANIVIFEIGCGGGQIGKFLTNANASKQYFKEDFKQAGKDVRYVQYYGIDPNLQTELKQQLMMINGSTDEMQRAREVLIDFNRVIQDEERMLTEKLLLTKQTMKIVLDRLKILNEKVKAGEKHMLFLTSIMKYHFKTKEQHEEFMNLLCLLAKNIESLKMTDSIYYISNEVYGKNRKLYPFEAEEYGNLQVVSTKFKNGKFGKKEYYPEYTWFFGAEDNE